MDDKFKEITAIHIPIVLLRWTRLPFRVKTASVSFQRAKENVLTDKISKWDITWQLY